jgi:hypothetical protein
LVCKEKEAELVHERIGFERMIATLPLQKIGSNLPKFRLGSRLRCGGPFGGASTLTRRPYDIMPDGRFVSVIVEESLDNGSPAAAAVHVVLNWFDELRARVRPTK